jgi:hypothetical protein
MFDRATDTVVVDVDDFGDQQHPYRGRVATEDLIVHIQTDDGFWHRLHPSTIKTACGIPVNFYKSTPRNGRRVEHPLAPAEKCDCWTRDERREADDCYREQFGQDFSL